MHRQRQGTGALPSDRPAAPRRRRVPSPQSPSRPAAARRRSSVRVPAARKRARPAPRAEEGGNEPGPSVCRWCARRFTAVATAVFVGAVVWECGSAGAYAGEKEARAVGAGQRASFCSARWKRRRRRGLRRHWTHIRTGRWRSWSLGACCRSGGSRRRWPGAACWPGRTQPPSCTICWMRRPSNRKRATVRVTALKRCANARPRGGR